MGRQRKFQKEAQRMGQEFENQNFEMPDFEIHLPDYDMVSVSEDEGQRLDYAEQISDSEQQECMDPMKSMDVEELEEQFVNNTKIVLENAELFSKTIYPAYSIHTKKEMMEWVYPQADNILNLFSFYRLVSCTVGNAEDMYAYLNEKMDKFFTVLYSFGKPIVYGVISYHNTVNLVLGVYDADDAEILKQIMEGLLNGIELQPFYADLHNGTEKEAGIISAIPSVKIGEEKQKFDLSSLLRSLNGQNYMVLFMARPVMQETIVDKYNKMVSVKDACFAVSKRNISRQQGTFDAIGKAKGYSKADAIAASVGMNVNAGLGFFGVSLGGGIFSSTSHSHSLAQNYSRTITNAVNKSEGIAYEIQNGIALELMGYADKAINRLKQGRNNGMWETVITYSADSKAVAGIIQACISGEMAKPDPQLLPQAAYQYHLTAHEAYQNSILLPKMIKGEEESLLCTMLTSEELGFICTPPSESVPNFELKKGKMYPLVTDHVEGVQVGVLCDGNRRIKHMPFSLSYEDLARHTFVCGITGSGKTTTIKGILQNAKDIPFIVIESAKKEYRNMKLDNSERPIVYTLGKPEINCLQFNPFYIPHGVSPQIHIDYLKDLFNASFSFYGPMPYILETCLHNIYRKKGWNLTLGFHPYLVDMAHTADFFDADYMQKKYKMKSHRYIFPTMQDLKDEIERYIEEEMNYEGEVAGNIKTAMKARLENLCTGAKGYMFNTYEYADMDTLMDQKAVFEMEGLADDSDKAFCVGLLIIFINEYRQVTREISCKGKPLAHLLVVEEAHRLLKNVDTERTTEDIGNPKGKAVEHFTNMIAEMRSYGQGVIIAEQIPSKLAPDVIKNSSNKIIQRLVSFDDQNLVANTIGLQNKDAVYIGNMRTGMALCHKEGMSLPVCVSISPVEEIQVWDDMLYGDGMKDKRIKDRLHSINYHLAKEAVALEVDLWGLKILNAVCILDHDKIRESLKSFRKVIKSTLKCRRKKGSLLIYSGTELISCEDENVIYAELLCESIFQYLQHGAYSVGQLIADELKDALLELLRLKNPNEECVRKVKELLWQAYKDDPAYKAKYFISQLVFYEMSAGTDAAGSVRNYFFTKRENGKTESIVPDEVVSEICAMIEKRW